MITKSPEFQFYPADYLSDSNTIVFTAEQDGHYLRLLCLCWLEGSIPIDPRPLLKGGATISDECLNPILKCFRLNRKKTALVHPRLDAERCKQIAWREKSSAGGKASALKKQELNSDNGASRVVEPKANTMFMSSSSSSSSNKKHISESFERDWKEYPRKAGNKRKAESCYLKSVSSEERRKQFLDKMKAYVASVDDPNYLMHGETFFRNWEDIEIPEKINKPKKKTTVRHNLDLIKNIDLGGEDDNKRIQNGDGDIVRVGTTT